MKGTFLFLMTAYAAFAHQSPTSTVCVEYRSANHPPSKICGLPVAQMPNLNQKEKTGRSANEPYMINFDPMRNTQLPLPYMIPAVPEPRTILIPPYGYKQPKSVPAQNTQDERNCNDLSHLVAYAPIQHTLQSILPQDLYKTDPLTNSHITRLAMIQTEQLRNFQEQEEKLQRLENQLETLMRNAVLQENDLGRTITASTTPSAERNLKTNKATTVKSD